VSEPPTYRFGPRPQRGVTLGLGPGQLLGLGAGLAVALGLMLARHVALGVVVLVATGAWSFVPVRGRKAHDWVAPIFSQLAGQRGAPAPLAVRSFGTGTKPLGGRGGEERAGFDLPGLRALEVAELESPVGPVGLVLGAGPLSFTLAICGRRFALEDEHLQAAIVGSWGQVLSAAAAGRIRRLQLTERAVPESGVSQLQWLSEADTHGDEGLVASYRAHLQSCLQGALRHEVYLTAALGGRFRAKDGAADECAALVELLRSSGFEARPLPARSLRLLLASMLHGHSRSSGTWERRWELVRAEGTCHACFEAAELPRVPVRADWTWPLLQGAPPKTARRWALHIELAPPAAGLRRAQRAVLSHDSEEALRARWGFRSGARTTDEADSERMREQELAAGFADARFVLLMAVDAPDPEALEAAARAAQSQAAACGVELRRLYGQQAEALASSLPLARLKLAGGWS
jgi:hypothetical protein